MTDLSAPKTTLREREAELDRRASLIDTDTDLSFGETLEVAARGMFLARHFAGRFLLKLTLMFFAIAVPLVMLPWPIKMIIDHVVLGTPIEEATGYPPIWHPFLDALAGSGPLEVLLAVMAVLALFVLLIGGYAQGDNTPGTRRRGTWRRATTRPPRSRTACTARTATSGGSTATSTS